MTASRDQLTQLIQAATADVAFLRWAREAVLTHPKVGMSIATCDAAICRLLAMGAVTAIEKIFEAWKGEAFLAKYESSEGSNGDRIRILSGCFREAGVTVNDDVLSDYLAIKYLRNGLVHLGWKKENELQFLAERGFTATLSQLDKRCWVKILSTARALIDYLSEINTSPDRLFAPYDEVTSIRSEGLDELRRATRDDRVSSMFVRPSNLSGVWWSNLEQILEQLPRVYDADGETVIEANDEQNPAVITELAGVALESWDEFLRTNPHLSRVRGEDVSAARKTFGRLERDRIYPTRAIGLPIKKWIGVFASQADVDEFVPEAYRPTFVKALDAVRSTVIDDKTMIWDLPLHDGIIAGLLPPILLDLGSDQLGDVAQALSVGSRLYQAVRNVTPRELFMKVLPVLDPARKSVYETVGRTADDYVTVPMAWYQWVEGFPK